MRAEAEINSKNETHPSSAVNVEAGADVFVEWLRRRGHHVVQSASSYWYDQGFHVFQAFPYWSLICPSDEELKDVFRASGALGIRYSTPTGSGLGAPSYHIVFTQGEYSLSTVSPKVRYNLRRGLRAVVVEPVSLARMATEGWELRYDTLSRQDRLGVESRDWWRTLCETAEGLPGFEAWAALVDGEMASSLLAFSSDSCYAVIFQQSRTRFLPLCVNNCLTYVVTAQVLSRPGARWVFYGLHSLTAPESVDRFKLHMGYRAKPLRQRVVFHPFLAPLVNPVSHALVRRLQALSPASDALAKAEGMIRFHLEGRRPLAKQAYPELLSRNNKSDEQE